MAASHHHEGLDLSLRADAIGRLVVANLRSHAMLRHATAGRASQATRLKALGCAFAYFFPPPELLMFWIRLIIGMNSAITMKPTITPRITTITGSRMLMSEPTRTSTSLS